MPNPGSNLDDHQPEGMALAPITLPIKRATAVSGLSSPTLYREAGKGNIKLLKYGRTTLVDMESLRAFLRSLPRASIRAPRSIS